MSFLNQFFFSILVMLAFTSSVCADQIDNPTEDTKISTNYNSVKEPFFVSLGSHCYPALFLREFGLRRAAFPFDWCLTNNSEKFLEMIDTDFAHFMDDENFVALPLKNGTLVHSYYNMQFVHEGTGWGGDDHYQRLQILKEKYQKRITRFRNLNKHKGKVFFVRAASSDAYRWEFPDPSNYEISEEYALRLSDSLKKLFPDLEFYLIILNLHPLDDAEVPIKIIGNVVISKTLTIDLRLFPPLFK